MRLPGHNDDYAKIIDHPVYGEVGLYWNHRTGCFYNGAYGIVIFPEE